MSMMSVPKSYTVLMGMEGYSRGMETKRKIKKTLRLEKGADEGGDDERREKERKQKAREEKRDSPGAEVRGEKGVSSQIESVENGKDGR